MPPRSSGSSIRQEAVHCPYMDHRTHRMGWVGKPWLKTDVEIGGGALEWWSGETDEGY